MLLSKKTMKTDSELFAQIIKKHKDGLVAKHQHGMKNYFFQPVEHERDSCVWSRRTEERMELAQTATWKKKTTQNLFVSIPFSASVFKKLKQSKQETMQ